MSSPTQSQNPIIQETIRKAEEQCLSQVQEEHKKAYLQLRQIILTRGADALNQEQLGYYQQMEQYVEASRKAAVDLLLQQNPQLAQQLDQQIDLNSSDYQSQVRNYIRDIVSLPMHALDAKLRQLYQDLLSRHYQKSFILQHIHNILTQLEQFSPDRSSQIATIWKQFQQLPNETEEEEGETINGQYVRPIPFTTPDDVITFMVLPIKAQNLLNQRTREGSAIPYAIFIKRRKGRPNKDTGVSHEFFTPVYSNGQLDNDVLNYFYSDNVNLARDVEQLAKKIYEQKEFYYKPENRSSFNLPQAQIPQAQMNIPTMGMQPMASATMQPTYSAMNYNSYGMQPQQPMQSQYMQSTYNQQMYQQAQPQYNPAQYQSAYGQPDYNHYNYNAEAGENQEDTSTFDDDASVIPTESDEFVDTQSEEDSTENEDQNQPISSSSSSTYSSASQSQSAEQSEALPSPEISEEVEEIDEPEIFIEKVVDCKEISITEAWKYSPSIMIVPRPPNCNKFDQYKPLDIKFAPRSDAGCILDRLDQLEEDVKEVPTNTITGTSSNQQTIMVYYIKWRDYAYCHCTWEVEDYLSHLASFAKVQTFKNDYNDKKLILQSDKLTSQEKEDIIEQQEEYLHNCEQYCYPEKIVTYEVREDYGRQLNQRLAELLHIMRERNFMSDSSIGVVSPAYDKLYYNNRHNQPKLDDMGYIVDTQQYGVNQVKGYFYLIKWKNLPYAESTWELHEDLEMMFSEETVRQLIKSYSKRSHAIKKMLSTNYLKFNERPIFKEFTTSHPDFLLDVNKEFVLKPHQVRGVNVLLYNYCQHKNVILADQLGLGKTIQAVTFLSALYHQFLVPGPFLVVAPLTTIQNWIQTINDWFPDCNLVTLIGSKKDRKVIIENELVQLINGSVQNKFHILLTTPSVAMIEELELKKFKYRALVFDEAHTIRNERTRSNKLFTSFTTDCKLLITGSPIQNSLNDLYALLHFIDAEVFKNQQEFEKLGSIDDFKDGLNKIVIKNESAEQELLNSTRMKDVDKLEKKNIFDASSDDDDFVMPENVKPSSLADTFVANTVHPEIGNKIEYIAQLLKPYILRRATSVLDNSLPERKEVVLRIPMTEQQIKLSQAIADRDVSQLVSNETVKLTNVLMQLKKVANHPYVLKESLIDTMPMDVILGESNKFLALDKLLAQLKQQEHRVLIFSQLKKTIAIIERYCHLKQYKYEKIVGDTVLDERIESINKFNAKNSEDFIFLLTTKLGQGINLQTADTVIIFDVDFNPQNDLQCIGRAHRIGQMKPVTIYRFLCVGSVEEKVFEVAQRKMYLDYALIQTQNQNIEEDQGILRNILKFGIEYTKNRPQQMNFEQLLSQAKEMPYDDKIQTPANVREIQYSDLQDLNENEFQSLVQQQQDPQFLEEQIDSIGEQELQQLIEAQLNFGLPKFARQIQQATNLPYSPAQIYTLLNSLLAEAKEHFRFSRLDIFNLPAQTPAIEFQFNGINCDAIKILKAFYYMFLIDLNVKNATFKLQRSLFTEFAAAKIWNSLYDTVLLLDVKQNGFRGINYQQYSAFAHTSLTKEQINERLEVLLQQLLKVPSPKLYDQIHADNLDTKITFDQALQRQDSPTDQKEAEILRRLQQGEFLRTTFTIPHEKHIFTSTLSQVMHFFTQERKRKISSIVSRFEEFSRSKFIMKEFIGISVMNGNQRLHKKLLSYLERFPLTRVEEDLLFKLYHRIIDTVVIRIGEIVQLVDEKISDMREKGLAINEIDNDSFIMKEVSELMDYLYRNVWVHCEIKHVGTPYVLAKLAEFYSESFEEELLNFDEEANGGWSCTLKLSGAEGQTEQLDVADGEKDYPY